MRECIQINNPYEVKTDVFEGPLDLLLHLIKQLEIDIYDIPMSEITDQYLAYINNMKSIELDIASEYLVMAATLLAIKSKMLLPKTVINDDDEYIEDPRDELIERLIEYRKYKEIANTLKEKELEDHQVYTRAPIVFKEILDEPMVTRGDVSIYDMLSVIGDIFNRKQWSKPLETKIDQNEVSIEECMSEILKKLSTDQTAFSDLFSNITRTHLVTTFLALLELMKENKVKCKQPERLGEIYVSIVEG